MNLLIKKNPITNELTRFLDEVFTDVNSNLNQFSQQVNALSKPPANIIENTDDYTLELLVPGWTKEDFEIKVEGEFLNISATKATPETDTTEEATATETPTVKYIKREFGTNSFKRTFTLNDKINKEDISANYENGILRIVLAKLEEVNTSRTVKIS